MGQAMEQRVADRAGREQPDDRRTGMLTICGQGSTSIRTEVVGGFNRQPRHPEVVNEPGRIEVIEVSADSRAKGVHPSRVAGLSSQLPGDSLPGMSAPPVSELLDLSGRVALVTGASGNIGAAIARRLHEAGAAVALHAHGDRRSLESLAESLGSRVTVILGDVEVDAPSICDHAVAAFGSLHVLVNNAGIQPVMPLLELDEAEANEVLRVNVGGVLAMTKAAARAMQGNPGPQAGCVVNIASIEGLQPAAGHSHYAASKAAVLMHTRAAALELGPHRIRVNAIAPGLVDRESLATQWPDGVARWQARAPLGRLGTPQDVADAVLVLASPAARWITGATLAVDGGMLANSTW